MLFIQVVGRLIQKQNIWFFQKQFSHQYFGTLTAGQIRNIPIQPDIHQTKGTADLFYFCINHIKIVMLQKLLNGTSLFQQLFHFFRGGFAHLLEHSVHVGFHIEKIRKSRLQYITDGHALFQNGMLVQISNTDIFRPFYRSFIWHQMPGNNIHKGRLSFPIGTDQSNVFSF